MKNAGARNLILAAAVLIVCVALPQAAFAQACPGGPFPTGPTPVVPTFLAGEGFSAVGDNLIEIPAFSPVNDPASPVYGFAGLCAIFGLAGTTTQMFQINAMTGVITTHLCTFPVAPAFQPCQGVVIRPIGAAVGAIPIGAAGLEATWLYAEYGDAFSSFGDNLFGVPRTTPPGTPPEALCAAHGLPAGSAILAANAFTGVVSTHLCGQVPLWTLTPGGAVMVRVPGLPGAAVAGGIF